LSVDSTSLPLWTNGRIHRVTRAISHAIDPAADPDEPQPAPLDIPASAAAFCEEILHFVVDPVQRQVLDCPSSRLLLCCTRQWGKSTMAAIKALHTALLKPESLILVAAPTERQSCLLLQKLASFTRCAGVRLKAPTLSTTALKFPNGSVVRALPGREDTVRGFSSVDLVIIDEAAMVPDSLYTALRPMLAVSQGDLWLMSTPRGPHGFFYQEWHNPPPGAALFSVPATECPRITPEFLADELRALGQALFAQEYLCRFTPDSNSLIDVTLLDALILPKEPLA
jgi:hypothetical protein